MAKKYNDADKFACLTRIVEFMECTNLTSGGNDLALRDIAIMKDIARDYQVDAEVREVFEAFQKKLAKKQKTA